MYSYANRVIGGLTTCIYPGVANFLYSYISQKFWKLVSNREKLLQQ